MKCGGGLMMNSDNANAMQDHGSVVVCGRVSASDWKGFFGNFRHNDGQRKKR
jgi:hypothetical protein